MALPSSHGGNARLTQWLLLLPPCLPGGLMLLLGWMRDAYRPAHDAAAILRARQQADGLYTAGSIALLGGLLMAAFVAWKILRPTPLEEEGDTDAPEGR